MGDSQNLLRRRELLQRKLELLQQQKQLRNSTQAIDAEVSEPKLESIFPKAPIGAEIAHPYATAIAKSGREALAIPAHFFNQYLLNQPREITESLGYEYPSEIEPTDTSSKIAGIGAKTAGVIGGLRSPIYKGIGAITKSASIPSLLKTGIRGAMAGAAYAPNDAGEKQDLLSIGNRLSQAGMGAGIGIGANVGGRFLTELAPIGGKLARKFGGISTKGVKWLKERGAKTIFDPLKEQVDYIKTHLTPKVYEIYQQNLSKFTKPVQEYAEKKLKIPITAIDKIKKVGYNKAQKIRYAMNDSTDDIVVRIEKGFQNKKTQADAAYKAAVHQMPKDTIIKGTATKNRLKNILVDTKWIDNTGNPTRRYKSGVSKELDGLYDFYNSLKTEKGMDKTEFSVYRDFLQRMLKDKPNDRYIMQTLEGLYDDAERTGMSGLQKARALERAAFQAEKDLNVKSLLKEGKLDKYHKLSSADKRRLIEIEKYTGEKFIDDLDTITAARELDKLQKYDIEKLGNKLQSAVDPKNTESIKRELKNIIGKDADEIFNRIKDHKVAMEFYESPGYPSRAGIAKKVLGSAMKGYYEGVHPKIENVKTFVRKSTSPKIPTLMRR